LLIVDQNQQITGTWKKVNYALLAKLYRRWTIVYTFMCMHKLLITRSTLYTVFMNFSSH